MFLVLFYMFLFNVLFLSPSVVSSKDTPSFWYRCGTPSVRAWSYAHVVQLLTLTDSFGNPFLHGCHGA